MSRLPQPGADNGVWGDVLNDFLMQAHKTDGSLKDSSVTTSALDADAVTSISIRNGAVGEDKLDGSVQNAIAAAVTSIVQDKQWIIAGPVNVAAVDVDYIAPAYILVPDGFIAVVTTVRARINSGANVNLRIVANGNTLVGLDSIVVTTSGVAITNLSLAISDGNLLAPVVNSTSGSPQNMTVMISYKLTKI